MQGNFEENAFSVTRLIEKTAAHFENESYDCKIFEYVFFDAVLSCKDNICSHFVSGYYADDLRKYCFHI